MTIHEVLNNAAAYAIYALLLVTLVGTAAVIYDQAPDPDGPKEDPCSPTS
jgi:hypothetical protein